MGHQRMRSACRDSLRGGRRRDTRIYIDYGAGSDATGDGTNGNPYKTLSKALSVAVDGSRIAVKDGTYYESNLANARTGVTIAALTPGNAVFTPSTPYTSWSKTEGATNVYEAVCTKGAQYGTWHGTTRLTTQTSVATVDENTDSAWLDDPNNRLYVNVGGGAPTDTVHLLDNVNTLLDSMGTGIVYDGLWLRWVGRGIALNAASAAALNCQFHQMTNAVGVRGAIEATAAGAGRLVQGCTVESVADLNVGVWVKTAGTGLTVLDSTFQNCYVGVRVQSGTGLVVHDSTFDNCQDGVVVETGTALVYNLLSLDAGHGAVQFTGAGTNGVARHCVAYAPAVPARLNHNAFIGENGATAAFYHCVASGLKTAAGNGYGFFVLTDGTTATVKNCAAVNCKVAFRANNNPTLTADYNGVYGNTSDYGGTLPFPVGAHDLATDPLMAGLPSDVHLGAGSPYIDAGVAVAGVNDGFLGVAPDIGRHEYA
jgi:hypothetical protein